MTEFCPICQLKGKSSPLKFFHMNFSEATKMCVDVKCPYPLRVEYTDEFMKQENDAEKDVKPPPNMNAGNSMLNLLPANACMSDATSITYMDKQNVKNTASPKPSLAALKSYPRSNLKLQMLNPPLKNNTFFSNSASVVKQNKFEVIAANGIKQEFKLENEMAFDWNSISNTPQAITLEKNEVKKEGGKASDAQSAGKELNQRKGKFEGFSFNEALKSINVGKCPSLIRRGLKMVKEEKNVLNTKKSGNRSTRFGGKRLKCSKDDKLKSQHISEEPVVKENNLNTNGNYIDNDLSWIEELLM